MIVATRYAKSILDLAIEKSQLDVVRTDMKTIGETCKENAELTSMLQSPIISNEKKLAVLKAIFTGNVSDLTLSFLNLLTTNKRESNLAEITTAFESQYRAYKNILTAEVTSAIGLDDKLRAEVVAIIKKSTSSEVELSEKVDKSIIGGFIIKIGDTQIDQSVSKQLANIKT